MQDLPLMWLRCAARSGDISVDDRIKLEASQSHAQHRGYKGAPLKAEVRVGCVDPHHSELCMASFHARTQRSSGLDGVRKCRLTHSDIANFSCWSCTASVKDWTLTSMFTVWCGRGRESYRRSRSERMPCGPSAHGDG